MTLLYFWHWFHSSGMEIIMVSLLFHGHETDNEVYGKQRTMCWMTILNLALSKSYACEKQNILRIK